MPCVESGGCTLRNTEFVLKFSAIPPPTMNQYGSRGMQMRAQHERNYQGQGSQNFDRRGGFQNRGGNFGSQNRGGGGGYHNQNQGGGFNNQGRGGYNQGL